MTWDHAEHHVFLLHFGGPTEQSEVEPFLRRLFEDPFIIRAPIPNFVRAYLARSISRKRAPHTNEQYKAIGYSPINRYTDIQAKQLEMELCKIRPGTKVHVVNRYTAPFADDVVRAFKGREDGFGTSMRAFMITLYPHFSHSTAGSSIRDFDFAWRRINGCVVPPIIRAFSWWHHKSWMDYSWSKLRKAIDQALQNDRSKPLSVVFSAHGLPQKYADRGDPYQHDIKTHVQELVARGRQAYPSVQIEWRLSFQSRVGPVEWLRPYTEDAIVDMGRSGGQIVLVPISFVSDHIETLFEMDVTYRELALRSGFSAYHRVEMPNAEPELAQCLRDVLLDYGF